MSDRSWFKKEMSAGTLLQIATMLVLAVGAYYKFDARMTRVEESTLSIQRRIEHHEETFTQIAQTETRLTTLIEERTAPPTYNKQREPKGAN